MPDIQGVARKAADSDVGVAPKALMWNSADAGATALPAPAKGYVGWLPVQQLKDAAVYMDAGPTGRSTYWPELFSFVHPECATTDTALNSVDEVWFSYPYSTVGVSVVLHEQPVTALSETVAELREMLDLPAAQVAAMCGVGRRQLYNLLKGSSASFGREVWVRKLHDGVSRLYELVDADSKRLRSMALLPVAHGRSLLDVAETSDPAALDAVVDALQKRILDGYQGRVRRPIPLKKGGGHRDEAGDFLAEYRERGD